MPEENSTTYRSEPIQIQLSGSGGQGLILSGIILASAGVADGFHAVQTQAYGPEARGGSSRAEVLISSEIIDYPHADKPDILLALTQDACNKYLPYVKPDAIVILDSLLVQNVPNTSAKVIKLPIIETARQDLGKEMVANIVALGALNAISHLVNWQSLESAVLNRVPEAFADLNSRALNSGRKLVEEYTGGVNFERLA